MDDNEVSYSLADTYDCGNDTTLISSIAFPDDVTDGRSDLYPWSRMIVGLNGNSMLILVDLTEKDKPTLQTVKLMPCGTSWPLDQPMPMAVSPDGKFFLISGLNQTLYHFDFTSRLISTLTELNLNLSNDIAAMSIICDYEKNMPSSGSSFEFFAKCQLGAGEFRCSVELYAPKEEGIPSSPKYAIYSARKAPETPMGNPEKESSEAPLNQKEDNFAVKSPASFLNGEGNAMDNENCSLGKSHTIDNLSDVAEDFSHSDYSNKDVVVEEVVYDDETDMKVYSSNDDRVKSKDENDGQDMDRATVWKEVATNTYDESSPSESVPRMLFDLVKRVNAIEHKLEAISQALGCIQKNQQEE